MTNAVSKATQELAHGIDPRAWAASHPWIALATAAVGGFVAATQIVPSRDEQMLKKLEKIREAVMGETSRSHHRVSDSDPADGKEQKSKGRGFLGIIGTEFLRFAGPAISSALSAAIAGKSVANAADQAQDAAQGQDGSANMADPASAI